MSQRNRPHEDDNIDHSSERSSSVSGDQIHSDIGSDLHAQIPSIGEGDQVEDGGNPPHRAEGNVGPPSAASVSIADDVEIMVESPPMHGVRWDLGDYTHFASPDAPPSIATAATVASAQHPPSSATGSSRMIDDATDEAAAAASSSQHLTARERLVERERQSRLERQRAQVKRRIALNREAEEMELARAGIDVEQNGDDATMRAGYEGDGSDAHQRMEMLDELAGRDGSIVGTVGDASIHGGDVEHHDHDYDVVDPAGGVGNSTASEGEQGGVALGYAMERFLSEQVVVTDRQDGAGIDDGDDSGTPMNGAGDRPVRDADDTGTNLETGIDVEQAPRSSQSHLDESNPAGRDIGDSVLDGLSLPFPQDSTISAESVGVSYPPNSTESIPPNSTSSLRTVDTPIAGSLDEDVLPSPPVRAGSYDLSTSLRSDETDDAHDSTNATTDFAPRLARLTEAEILEMNTLDYASVGNVPPRSVRDEDERLLTMGSFIDGIGVSVAGTQTTAVETVSTPSGRSTAGGRQSPSSIHSEAGEETSALLALSPVVIGSDGDTRRGSMRVAVEDDGPDIIMEEDRVSRLDYESSSSPHDGSHQLAGSAIIHSASPSLLQNTEDMDLDASEAVAGGQIDFHPHLSNGYAHHTERRLRLEQRDGTSPAVATLGECVDEDGIQSPQRLDCPLLDQDAYHSYGAVNGEVPHAEPVLNIANGSPNARHGIPSEVLLNTTDSSNVTDMKRTLYGTPWLKTEVQTAWLGVAFCFGVALGVLLSKAL